MIAYITPEIALPGFDIHSGGLGTLAQGYALSVKKLGVPAAMVSFLPRCGYYDQSVQDGKMKVSYVSRGYDNQLENIGTFSMPLCGAHDFIRIWRVNNGDMAPVYLLDTDIDENGDMRTSPARATTRFLYGGDETTLKTPERVIAQNLVLGRGAVFALDHLGIKVSLYHLNDSHGAFAGMELFRRERESGADFDEALSAVKRRVVFTTHTPVLAGNHRYPIDDIYRDNGLQRGVIHMGSFGPMVTRDDFIRLGGEMDFNMGAACMSFGGKANAVSEFHLSVAKEMFAHVNNRAPLTAVTNGTPREFWQCPEFRDAQDPAAMSKAKIFRKRILLNYLQAYAGKYWDETVPICCWARRFAEYKRPDLIAYDMEWLAGHLRSNDFRLVIAGKPHPDDHEMVRKWNNFYALSEQFSNLAVLPGYNLEMSRMLKAGADIWLNTPRAQEEACGTSGMSAAMNGALNVSTPSGWMWEERRDYPKCYRFFGSDGSTHAGMNQNAFDANDLRRALNVEILPMLGNPEIRYPIILDAKRRAETKWTSDRMLRDYLDFYAQEI